MFKVESPNALVRIDNATDRLPFTIRFLPYTNESAGKSSHPHRNNFKHSTLNFPTSTPFAPLLLLPAKQQVMPAKKGSQLHRKNLKL